MGVYEDILTKVAEPDRATLDKYPDLKAAIQKLEADYTDADTRLKGYEGWYAANWDPERKMTRREVELTESLTAAQQRADQLETLGETEMTFDDILKQTQPHIKQAVDGAVNPLRSALFDEKGQPKLTARDEFNQALVGMQMFYANTANLPAQHYREFGEDMDMPGFIKHVFEHEMGARTKEAYDQFVADKRAAARAAADQKREQETSAKIEAARKEGEDKARREMVVTSGRGTPSDAGVGASALGPLSQRLDIIRNPEKAKDSARLDPSIKLTDSRLSQLAAEEFFKKQMGAA